MSLIEDIGYWLYNINRELLLIWKYLPFILMGLTILILRHYFMFPKKDDGIRYVSWRHTTMRWLVPVLTIITTIMWSKTYGYNMIMIPAVFGLVILFYLVIRSNIGSLYKVLIVILVGIAIYIMIYNFQWVDSVGGGAI